LTLVTGEELFLRGGERHGHGYLPVARCFGRPRGLAGDGSVGRGAQVAGLRIGLGPRGRSGADPAPIERRYVGAGEGDRGARLAGWLGAHRVRGYSRGSGQSAAFPAAVAPRSRLCLGTGTRRRSGALAGTVREMSGPGSAGRSTRGQDTDSAR